MKFNYDIYAVLITSSTLINLAVRIKNSGFIIKFNLFWSIVMVCSSLANGSVRIHIYVYVSGRRNWWTTILTSVYENINWDRILET